MIAVCRMEEAEVEGREPHHQRRMAAGRSGGFFERVQDGDQFIYRYVWPESYQQESNVAWESVEPVALSASATTATQSDSESVRSGTRGWKNSPTMSAEDTMTMERTSPKQPKALSSPPSSSTSPDGMELAEEVASRPKRRRGQKTLKKIDRLVHRFMHGRKERAKANNDEAVNAYAEPSEHQISPSQVHTVISQSPVKQQFDLELETNRDSEEEEEVNKEFFTPPRASKRWSAQDYCANSDDSNIFE